MRAKKFDGLEGASFGITSGVITILGVLIGLAATGNKIFTEIGIIIVGIADALSDAAGMYVSEESEYVHTGKEVLKTAFFTFVGKILTLIVLIIPLAILDLFPAVLVSLVIGVVIMVRLGYVVAKGNKKLKTWRTIAKYVSLVLVVSFVSYFIGYFANAYLGGLV
ncbi:MAG: hypothetical protein J7K73_03180 [Nanoarchaeota archaeon]|nr:hypothetical protein [Nanoarchaeota archaeon]